jgi:hypothetical protein
LTIGEPDPSSIGCHVDHFGGEIVDLLAQQRAGAARRSSPRLGALDGVEIGPQLLVLARQQREALFKPFAVLV